MYLAKQQLPTTENEKYINESKTMTAGDTHRTTGSHTEADLNVMYEYERRSRDKESGLEF